MMIYRKLKDFALAREPHREPGREADREPDRGPAFLADFGRVAMLAGGAGAWALHSVLPLIALDRGDLDVATAWAERLLALSDELDFEAGTAHARALLGDLYARRGEYHEATEWYGQALDGYEKLDDEDNAGRMLAAMADVERARSTANAQAPEAHSEALRPHSLAGRMARATLVKLGRPVEARARKHWLERGR